MISVSGTLIPYSRKALRTVARKRVPVPRGPHDQLLLDRRGDPDLKILLLRADPQRLLIFILVDLAHHHEVMTS